jgi:hypothetical protein
VHVGDYTTPTALQSAPDIVVGNIALIADLDGEVGSASLQVIIGNVVLTDSAAGAVNFVFPRLSAISGRLQISNNVGLSNLDGNEELERPAAFPSLVFVGSDLSINNNANLINLGSATDAAGAGALPSLTTVSGNFSVDSNGSLASLALPSLTTVGGSVSVTGNTQLRDAIAEELCEVRGDFVVGGNLIAQRNTLLSQLSICTQGPLAVDGQVFVDNRSTELTCAELSDLCVGRHPDDVVSGDNGMGANDPECCQ